MAARKQRQPRPDELAALKKYGGKTRKQFNAENGKFAGLKASQAKQLSAGNFRVIGLFEGKMDRPDTDHLPNLSAAWARFQKLVSNPYLRALRLVEDVPLFTEKGEPNGMQSKTLFSFIRSTTQQFANSKAEGLWKRPGEVGLFSTTAIKKNPNLAKQLAAGKLEYVKTLYSGGEAWWERRN